MADTTKVRIALKEMRNDLKMQTKNNDKEKIRYLFFDKLFSIVELEQYFRYKYTYNELRDIVRQMYKEYFEEEKTNGRS